MNQPYHWYIVTGRIEFDDEDTLLVLHCENDTDASIRFRDTLRAEDPLDLAEGEQDERAIFTNYIVDCGEQEPQIVACPV